MFTDSMFLFYRSDSPPNGRRPKLTLQERRAKFREDARIVRAQREQMQADEAAREKREKEYEEQKQKEEENQKRLNELEERKKEEEAWRLQRELNPINPGSNPLLLPRYKLLKLLSYLFLWTFVSQPAYSSFATV